MKNSSYVRFFENEIDAKNYVKFHNNSLTTKAFHKYFRVMIDGPDNNFAVVDFKTAYDMQVAYSM